VYIIFKIGYHPWNLQKHRSQVKKKTETLSAKRGLSGSAWMDSFVRTHIVAENWDKSKVCYVYDTYIYNVFISRKEQHMHLVVYKD
jgi:hypothetical protein